MQGAYVGKLGLMALGYVAVAAMGCAFQEDDAMLPGEPLGTFEVSAALEESTCGDGALAAPKDWVFEVQLSRDRDYLYWLNGEAPIEGSVDDGGEFSIQSGSRYKLTDEDPVSPGCTVLRADTASGVLGEGEEPTSFSGEIRYDYTVENGKSCTDLIGIPEGFQALPCSVRYDFEASRTKAPE